MKERKTILICDDELDILEVLKLILIPEYRVHTISRIRNIVEEVINVNPDLILMDHWIPEIGGREAVLRLKEDKRTGHIPVLFISANNAIEQVVNETRADGYIAKPFQIGELREYVSRVIEASVIANAS